MDSYNVKPVAPGVKLSHQNDFANN